MVRQVILADIDLLRPQSDNSYSSITYLKQDVRTPPQTWALPEKVDLIANFAAIHREPGHEDDECYQTNLLGAENVCAWAERVGYNNIIFQVLFLPTGQVKR